MELTFRKHPFLQPPTDEEIVLLAEKDPQLLEQLYNAHEGRIQASEEDPVRYGFDLPGWERMRKGLGNYNECLVLGGNRSGKTTGCAKMVMQAVMNNTDRRRVPRDILIFLCRTDLRGVRLSFPILGLV